MAKYVYVVLKKQFFNERGVDIPLAVGMSDISTFSTMKKAEEYVKEFVRIIEECPTEPKFEIYNDNPADAWCDDYCMACKVYAQQKYNRQGLRVGFMILKEIIE